MARTTPIGLTLQFLLCSAVAALLGSVPLASWLDTAGFPDAAGIVQAAGARTGLDLPYKLLHEGVKNAEAAKFFDPR